jgi:hypothetical protein
LRIFYRKLRNSGNELSKHKASKSGSSSGYPSAAPEERVCEETITRCPCGSNVETGTMIQVFLTNIFSLIPFYILAFVFAGLHLFLLNCQPFHSPTFFCFYSCCVMVGEVICSKYFLRHNVGL